MFCLVLAPLAAQVTPAPEFESQFQRTQGWTGADGTYSVPLDDGTLWLFSDTFFGQVEEGRRVDAKMVNNSLVVQDGSGLEFLRAPSFTHPKSVGWFWLMDCVREGEWFEILLGHIRKEPEGFLGFRQIGCWYARFRLDGGRVRVDEYKEIPHYGEREDELITWGTALHNGPVWTYIFGTHDRGTDRDLVVARAPRGSLGEMGTWRFYDGKGWSLNKWAAASLFRGASNESSVFPTASGGFFYVGGGKELKGGKILGRHAPRITGPWSDEVVLHTAPEVGGNVISYNAKAHPELSSEGKLLVSYNVNTTDLWELLGKADIYRPRFFWWTPPNKDWLPLTPRPRGT
jgi:Domain of unknown function (DUF4185)